MVFKIWERKLSVRSESIEKFFNDRLTEIDAKINEKAEVFSLKIAACREELANDRQVADQKIKEEISKLNISDLALSIKGLEVKTGEIGKAYQVALDHILEFETQLNKRASILEDAIEENRKILSNSLSDLKVRTEDSLNTNQKKLEGQMHSIKGLDDLLKKLEKSFDKKAADIELTIGSLKETGDKNLKSSEAKFGEALNLLEKSILEGSKSLISECEQQIERMESKVNSLGSAVEKADKDIYHKIEEVNTGLTNQLLAHEASVIKFKNEFYLKLEDSETGIRESLDTVKRNSSLINKTTEGLKKTDLKIKDTLKKLKDNQTKLDELTERYRNEIQIEKTRISKSLALGRASFSGFQMFFNGKYEGDKVQDSQTLKRLKRYDDSVSKFGFLNGHVYQRFNRNLDRDKINKLIQEWQSALDVQLSEDKLAYMAHKVWLIESTCSGRLATNVEDEIIRCLIAAYVGENGLRGIEIGALFGVNICCLKELASPFCKSFHLTVVDPLEGYYAKQPNDILVDEPINEEIFWKNIKRYCRKSEVRLIKKFTNDMDARNFAKNTFNFVLIDGDHTYDGVNVDFNLIKDFVEPGGFILFDDYNTTHWPDVKTYVDETVLTDNNYKEIVSMFRTCVVQKLK